MPNETSAPKVGSSSTSTTVPTPGAAIRCTTTGASGSVSSASAITADRTAAASPRSS
jgi:hypothetical protein